MTVIDTPEGIAFFKAAARKGALQLGKPGVLAIVKQVYGFTGSGPAVLGMLTEYVEGTLEVREWSPKRAKRAQDIAQVAIAFAEEAGAGSHLQQFADHDVQSLFQQGAITEQEGNDACLLIFVEVVRQHALAVEPSPRVASTTGPITEGV